MLGHNFIVSSTYRERRDEMYGLNSPGPSKFFLGLLCVYAFSRVSSQVYRKGCAPDAIVEPPGAKLDPDLKVSLKVDQNLRVVLWRSSALSMYQIIPLLQNLLLREGLVKGWQEC